MTVLWLWGQMSGTWGPGLKGVALGSPKGRRQGLWRDWSLCDPPRLLLLL